jgi:hypothetical protein
MPEAWKGDVVAMADEKIVWTVQHFAAMRLALMTVIDDGNPKHAPIGGERSREWYLWSYQESTADEERLDFCSAVQAAITKEALEGKDNG